MPHLTTRLATNRVYISLAALAILSSLFLAKNVDLRVYWYGVNGFFAGVRPAYGPHSGIGFPMEYRYPPVTYLILFPLRLMPLRVAGVCWMLGAWTLGTLAVALAIHTRRMRFSGEAILACCAFMLAYLVLAVRYGNVQPFVIAALFLALVLSETHPLCAGVLFAFAVTFKVWPVMFLPLFFPRARRRSALFFLVSLAILWLLPILLFGPAGYWSLLRDWYSAVARVGSTYSEFYYFPGQSLRSLLLRYFTPVAPPLITFPEIHVLSLRPRVAIEAWMSIGAVAYGFLVFQMLRSDPRKLWAWDGLAFALYTLLEPYAVKSGLISLGPAALTAACLLTLSRRWLPKGQALWASRLFLSACLLSLLGAAVQYRPWQRMLLTVGLDFWSGLLLLAALFIWIVFTPLAEKAGHSSDTPLATTG